MADGLTFAELFEDLVAASARELPPDYFTTRKYAERTGMPERSALKDLMTRVEAGGLETKLAVVDGHQARIFWFVGDE